MRPISQPPYECAGNGLLYNGESRTPLDSLRSWLFPKRKNATPIKKPKSWWQAQLALYGIEIPKNSSTIASLRAKLEAALQQGLCDRLPPHLQEMEDSLNAQYVAEKNQQLMHARAERKRRLLQAGGSDEEIMAIEDPLSMLQQKFMSSNGNASDVCILTKLESYERASVHQAAARLGLVCISVDAPDGGRWMVLGKERGAVSKEIAHIHKAKLVAQEEKRARKRQKMEEKHAQVLSESNGQMSLEGQWLITCSYIEEQWPTTNDLTLSITRTHKGKMVGKFDFGVIAGVLKFRGETSGPLASKGERLEFRWRGEEVETGMILYMDKEQRGWVSLQSDGHLEGKFKWQGNYKLSGFKSSETPVEIDETWDDYNEAAYESRRVGRW